MSYENTEDFRHLSHWAKCFSRATIGKNFHNLKHFPGQLTTTPNPPLLFEFLYVQKSLGHL